MKPMSSKIFARGIGAVAVAMAGVLTLAGRATGADYDYGVPSPDFLQAPPQNKVEFASNWYVRGDLAYAAETFPKIAPDSTFGSSPSVLNTYSVGPEWAIRSTIGSGRTSFSITARRFRRLPPARR